MQGTAIKAYDPPGFLPDFEGIPGQLEAWSTAVSGWFDGVVESDGGRRSQYFNQLRHPPAAPALEQEIVWNGFPGTMRNRYGRRRALELADDVVPLSERTDGLGSYNYGDIWTRLYYRPQDEYCEWRVERDAQGRITRVTFTSEPPEYWMALHGDTLPDVNGNPAYQTPGDPGLLVELYQRYVSEEVVYEDLICPVDLYDEYMPGAPVYAKGSYNPYNKWNTTHGIMHLTQPANSLTAEIQLGGDATVLREAFDKPITEPDALMACAAYGGPNRCSDPTIGASVNNLAALGFDVTLRNPVGLYMDHLDMTGWTKPNGDPVEDEYFKVLRGREDLNLIERAVFEVPAEEGFTVGDLRIGGDPIRYGGQLAEHMTVKLVGLASAGSKKTKPVPCEGQTFQGGSRSRLADMVSFAKPAYVSHPPPGAPRPPRALTARAAAAHRRRRQRTRAA